MKGFTTINTDASYNHNKKIGGYGIWIKNDDFNIKVSGQFKSEVNDSNESEIKALINAFYLLENKNVFDNIIVVNCDNSVVRGIVNNNVISERFKNEGKLLIEFIKKYKKVYAKNIKGHKSNFNKRQFVNNWCDKASRQYINKL